MKKHWPKTQENHNLENITEDAHNFILLQTGLSVGWQEEDIFVVFKGWYEGVEFNLPIDPEDRDLYQTQKEIYNYCRDWKKGETREHEEYRKHQELISSIAA